MDNEALNDFKIAVLNQYMREWEKNGRNGSMQLLIETTLLCLADPLTPSSAEILRTVQVKREVVLEKLGRHD